MAGILAPARAATSAGTSPDVVCARRTSPTSLAPGAHKRRGGSRDTLRAERRPCVRRKDRQARRRGRRTQPPGATNRRHAAGPACRLVACCRLAQRRPPSRRWLSSDARMRKRAASANAAAVHRAAVGPHGVRTAGSPPVAVSGTPPRPAEAALRPVARMGALVDSPPCGSTRRPALPRGERPAGGLRRRRRGPPLVLLHGASSTGREDFGAQLPRLSPGVHLLPARRAGPRPDRLRPRARPGASRARRPRRRPGRVRRRPGDRDLRPRRLLDGRRHRARLRDGAAGAASLARARRCCDGARAPDERHPAPRRRRPDRAPGRRLGGGPRPPPRPVPGRRCLAAPDAGDRRLRGIPGAADARPRCGGSSSPPWWWSAIAIRSYRSRRRWRWRASSPMRASSSCPAAATRSRRSARASSSRA